MKHIDFCTQILELSAPWQVDSIKVDQPARRLDIFIGFDTSRKRSRFGILPPTGLFAAGRHQPTCPHCHAALPQENGFSKVCLRHLPIAGMQTYLHVPAPGSVQSPQPNCFCMRKWAASGTEFTQAMRDHILTMLRAVADDQTVARLAGITSSEVKRSVRPAVSRLPAANNGNQPAPQILPQPLQAPRIGTSSRSRMKIIQAGTVSLTVN